jgi:hypothetical protein
MAFEVKYKEFYMSKSIISNGEFVYDYKGKDDDVINMLSHLGCPTNWNGTVYPIYTEHNFNIIQKLASYHGWEIMITEEKGN